MARRALDQIPQRELLDRLRIEIEPAMAGRKIALRHVDRLVAENPRSWASTYVAWNLGKRKFSWLWWRVATTRPAALPPGRVDRPASLAKVSPWEPTSSN